MLEFILTSILMLALGTILYLIVRTLPRINEDEVITQMGFMDRWVSSGIPEKIDAILNSFLEKFLRKVKISLLKIDNFLAKRLQKIKTENGNGLTGQSKPKIDFSGINGKIAKEAERSDNESK